MLIVINKAEIKDIIFKYIIYLGIFKGFHIL